METNEHHRLPHRTRQPRGLPSKEDRLKLANVWLENQTRLWPELVGTELLPEATPDACRELAEAFEATFTSRQVPDCRLPSGVDLELAASYLRYSSPQQSKRSLDDQLFLQLKRAKEDGVFIPWCWVFADAGVSGTIANRTGYQLLKKLVSSDGPYRVKTVYIDELARATRNTIEALKLGQLIANHDKRLIGVSDGFDSSTPQAKASLMFSAFLAEQFVDQHRYRVRRGHLGAEKRGSIIGRVPVGYKPVPLLDPQGRQVTNGRDKPVLTYGIDEEWKWVIEHIDRRFVEDRWSARRIAQEMNRLEVQGKRTWATGTVTRILRDPLYIGVRVHNRWRRVHDPVTGTSKKRTNHWRQWRIQHLPHLQLRSRRRWRQIKRRLAEVHQATPGRGKGSAGTSYVYPSTLFSNTLICGCCGRTLQLWRSKGENKQMYCRAAAEGREGCTMKGSKSVRIIERAILDYVRSEVLTPERLERLVEATNRYLAEEAAKPRVDTSSLEQTIERKKRQRDRWLQLLGAEDDPDLAFVRGEVKKLGRELRGLESELNDLRAKNAAPPPPPVDLEQTLAMLDDLHGLVSGSPEAAGPVLRELLGPITVRQVKKTDHPKPLWVAQIGPDLVPLVARAARSCKNPSSCSWCTLAQRGWSHREKDTVLLLGDRPRYQVYAQQVKRLVDAGMSVPQAGTRLGIPRSTAYAAYAYARDGTTWGETSNGSRDRRQVA